MGTADDSSTGSFFPERFVFEQTRNEGGVHGVARAVRNDVAEDLLSEKGKVSDEVEDFVADKLVVETQRGIHDAVAGEHDGIVGRSAADKALLAEHVGFVNEAEGARGRNVFQSSFRRRGRRGILPCRSSGAGS